MSALAVAQTVHEVGIREYRFERTVRIIWFTGEEQGMYGSAYYAAAEKVGFAKREILASRVKSARDSQD